MPMPSDKPPPLTPPRHPLPDVDPPLTPQQHTFCHHVHTALPPPSHAVNLNRSPADPSRLTQPEPEPRIHGDEVISEDPDDQAPDEEPENGVPPEMVDDMRAVSELKHIQITSNFKKAVENATLDSSALSEDALHRLCNPPSEPLTVNSTDYHLSLELFLATCNASKHVYHVVRDAIHCHPPDLTILSLDQVKNRLLVLTDIDSIMMDMCINSCLAFMGPFKHDIECAKFHAPQYELHSPRDTPIPWQQFHTIPILPILQVLCRNPRTAERFNYLWEHITNYRTAHAAAQAAGQRFSRNIFDDFDTGSDFSLAILNGKIGVDNTVLMFSIDSAQLYHNKQSDCWIGTFTILNFSPDIHYLKDSIFPAFTIPGHRPPIYHNSFLTPTLEHLSTLQKEGLEFMMQHWEGCHLTIHGKPT